jgi:hypothetical protein
MQEDAELPNSDHKKKNIKDALRLLVDKKFRIPGSKKDEVEAFIKDPQVMPVYEDAMPCKGRVCLACEGCDSFRMNISEVKEIVDKEENFEDVPPMKAAAEAAEANMRDIEEMMHAIHQRTNIKFSRWEIIKFMREAIKTAINVDIFVVKKDLNKFQKTYLKNDDWIVIRTVMIINQVDWWLEDIKSLKDKDIFYLYKVDKLNYSYLPLQMAFPLPDGTYQSVKQFVDGQNPKVRNKIMTVQNHLGSMIESTVKWTTRYQG